MVKRLVKTRDIRALRAGRDTGIAKLPGIPRVQLQDRALQRTVDALIEHVEVRAGVRGNDAERVVTQREFREVAEVAELTKDFLEGPTGQAYSSAAGAIAAFEAAIKRTKLFKDLMKRLDDPSRFNDLPEALRRELLKSVATQAREAGNQVTRLERIIEDRFSSLVYKIEQVTASSDRAAAGIRETMFALGESDRAQAGMITQVEARLDDVDGMGASVEQVMTATVDRVAGLDAQYTLKVQAGGALAGFGVAATEVDGVPSSAFIITADKFAIVSPTYNGGLTTSPDSAHIPFGVDNNGIYLNYNVYMKGNTFMVDVSGAQDGSDKRPVITGLRGSVSLSGGASSWTDTAARNAVWSYLGNPGSAPDSKHLVIGDTVRIGNQTRIWNGSQWLTAGMFINGNMVVDGSLAATKIDTRGLTIKDNAGNVIFSAGNGLDWTYIKNAQIDTADIKNAAITNAKIGNAEVDRLKLAGQSVTIPVSRNTTTGTPYCSISLPEATKVIVIASLTVTGTGLSLTSSSYASVTITVAGASATVIIPVRHAGTVGKVDRYEWVPQHVTLVSVQSYPAGSNTVTVTKSGSGSAWVRGNVTLIGAMR